MQHATGDMSWIRDDLDISAHTHTGLRLPAIIMTKFQLVIFSLADYLLADWSEKDDVFVLCCVAALDVTKKGVWVHNPRVTKCYQVLV